MTPVCETTLPVTRDPVVALLASWGLAVGRQVQGFTILRVAHGARGAAALITLERGAAQVQVQLVRASDAPRFARVGELDLSHAPVDPALSREVGGLLRLIAAWLSRHGNGAELVPLLVLRDEPDTAAPPPVAELAQPPSNHAYDAGEAPENDPARRTPADRPFMRFDTIDLADIERYPDALRDMYAGKLGGLVIRGVYSKEDMARITATLGKGEVDYPRTSFPPRFNAHFYGRCLDGSDPQLGEYLTDAARFRAETLSVFQGTVPFEERMEQVFRALAGSRDVRVPRFGDGRAYTPATIRIILEGGQIGSHCGNEASTRPAYTHLNSLIDRGDQISYFLTLQEPVAGGELIVYSLKWSDIDASRIVGGRSQVDDLLREAEWMAVAPTAGDLLIFDGGRYFHRVDIVKEPRVRWTIGGFMMFDTAGDTVYYWS